MIALALGTLLAVAAMAFVLWPLFRDPDSLATEPALPPSTSASARRERAVDALREIEFDRATGKLSDADYTALKTRYTTEAVAALRAESGGDPATDDAVEALIEKARARASRCVAHGLRPEPDAVYCSECGRFLGGACQRCGATVTAAGARFCDSCGHRLAA